MGHIDGCNPALAFGQRKCAREERGGVAVFPQAQEDQVQDRGLPGKELPELRLVLPGRGGRVVGGQAFAKGRLAQPPEVGLRRAARLVLVETAAAILKTGLALLGIKVLEKI